MKSPVISTRPLLVDGVLCVIAGLGWAAEVVRDLRKEYFFIDAWMDGWFGEAWGWSEVWE